MKAEDHAENCTQFGGLLWNASMSLAVVRWTDKDYEEFIGKIVLDVGEYPLAEIKFCPFCGTPLE